MTKPYTPSPEEMRQHFAQTRGALIDPEAARIAGHRAEMFDRFIAQVRAETLRGAADVVRTEARWQQENIMRGAVQKSEAQTAVERLLVVEELLRQQAGHFESADRIEREGS